MKKSPYELVFGKPAHHSSFPGVSSNDGIIIEADVGDIVEDESYSKSESSNESEPKSDSSGNELATSSKHHQLRKEADKQYRLNAERMQLKYIKGRCKKVQTFSPGEFVSVCIPRIDRTSTDSLCLPCIIVEHLGSKFFLYRLRCADGVLKLCCSEGELEPFEGQLNISMEGWEQAPVLSLREAAKLFNPNNEFHSSICHCKTKCGTQRCACRLKGVPCSSKCHGGKPCVNCHTSPCT